MSEQEKEQKESKPNIFSKASPEKIKSTNLSLVILTALLLISLSGITYLYFGLRKGQPKTGRQQRYPTSLQEAPTLTPEKIEVVRKQKSYIVTIQNGTVNPQTMTINANDQVEWENKSSETYRIKGEGWGDIPIGPGESFTQMFAEVGDFPYTCALHPSLNGLIAVE